MSKIPLPFIGYDSVFPWRGAERVTKKRETEKMRKNKREREGTACLVEACLYEVKRLTPHIARDLWLNRSPRFFTLSSLVP